MISDSVKRICSGAFYGCDALMSVTIPGSVEVIEKDAFMLSYALGSVTISEGVTTIGEGAFYGTLLTSVYIPDSVKSIGDCAFDGCERLKEVSLPKGIALGENAFPEGVKIIYR